MAQNNRGWSTEANDAMTRSLAAFEVRKQFDTTALALMSKSNVFRNSLPKSVQVLLGFTVDTIGYALGVDTWVNSTLDLVQVQENSLASQLGFRDGDRIISIDGIYPSDLDAFKWHLKQKKGKTVPVTILREGEEQSIKIYVPNLFPSGEE